MTKQKLPCVSYTMTTETTQSLERGRSLVTMTAVCCPYVAESAVEMCRCVRGVP